MNSKEVIESGILESYIFGFATEAEVKEVEEMAVIYPEIRQEIIEISIAFEKYALDNAIEPDPTIRPFFLATIDYTERLKNGELAEFPPLLNSRSTPLDYNTWLSREDMILPADAPDVFAKIIGGTAEVTTAIVWLRDMAPQEAHHDEFERFLIIEGSCEIVIGSKIHKLVANDYLEIPLHQNHHVKVTSLIPCKIILQRVAAA
jgi:mannose-6-phosphate isomerase-like protein (cupin superfamily)